MTTMEATTLAAAAVEQLRQDLSLGDATPVVVALGVADTLIHDNDEWASVRAQATVHLAPQTVLIGPWGGGTACGRCLAMRWQRLRPRYTREALEYGQKTLSAGEWPVLSAYQVDAVRALFQQAALGRRPAGESMVSQLDLATLQVRTYPLLADPLCPTCAPDSDVAPRPAPLALRSRTKPAPDVYRVSRPDAYPVPAEALVNPVCGLLGPTATMQLVTPTTAPVFGRVLMHGDGGFAEMTWSGQTNSYGNSRHVAYLEGLERYAGTRSRTRATPVYASYEELGADALDPRDCGVYPPETFERDDRLRPFDPTKRIPWVWAHSLRDNRPLLVPSRLAYYSAGDPDDNFVFECSNGCASGGSLEEATLFGLLELIERDAFLLAWYGGARLTEIDVSELDDRRLRRMLDRADLRGYDVRVFDNRVDIDVPVVTAVAERRGGGDGAIAFAAAAGLDPRTTVQNAVEEVLTFIPELPVRVETRRAAVEAMAADFHQVRELRDHSALMSLPQMSHHAERYTRADRSLPFDEVYRGWDAHRPSTTDLLDDLAYCRDQLVAAGFDVIVVDQSAPEQRELGLHTVATIVPGLIPIDFGWGNQRALTMPRLRTAFRRAGWRDTDLDPAELVRIPHPFP